MKAAQISQHGPIENIQVVDDAAQPTTDAGEVLVEVSAAGVNPSDWKTCAGEFGKLPMPATLGGDFSGVVVEVGEGVHDVKTGDEVFGRADVFGGQGSFAQLAVAKADSLALKPSLADFDQAGALPLAGVSAVQALIDHARLQPGQRILIHGGTGGIGSLAVQLAKHLGAHVAATVAPKDLDFVKSLGAELAIDYTTQDFTKRVQDYDVVFDTVGGEVAKRSYKVLAPSGILVSMLAKPDQSLMRQYHVTAVGQLTKATRQRLQTLASFVDQGAIKVVIDKSFALDDIVAALRYLQSGQHHGKIVIRPTNNP